MTGNKLSAGIAVGLRLSRNNIPGTRINVLDSCVFGSWGEGKDHAPSLAPFCGTLLFGLAALNDQHRTLSAVRGSKYLILCIIYQYFVFYGRRTTGRGAKINEFALLQVVHCFRWEMETVYSSTIQ